MPHCLIGIGSNLGDRAALLDAAITELDSSPHVQLRARSRDFKTPPVGGPTGQGSFLNAAALIESSLAPQALLAELRRIETDLGRYRAERWGPRRIDLDLLLYDDATLDSEDLKLPHPRMAWRRFVLEPAVEVAPSMVHPTTGWTIQRLLDHLQEARPYVAIAGLPASGKTQLARQAAEQTGGRWIGDPNASLRGPREPVVSSGGRGAIEVEFLNRRAAAISIQDPRWQSDRTFGVSDFWLGQSLAYAEACLTPRERDPLLARWKQVAAEACPPKLTVLLDGPASWCVARGAPLGEGMDQETLATVGEVLRRQLTGPGNGPVLVVDARDPAGALTELTISLTADVSSPLRMAVEMGERSSPLKSPL